LTESDWDEIIRCGLQFSADTCRHTDNYISREFADSMVM
jgi:fructokinase